MNHSSTCGARKTCWVGGWGMYKNIAHEDPRPGFSIFNDRGNAEEAQQRKRRQVEYVPDEKSAVAWNGGTTEGCSKGQVTASRTIVCDLPGLAAQHGGGRRDGHLSAAPTQHTRSLAAFAFLETHQNNCSNVAILFLCCPSPGLGPFTC